MHSESSRPVRRRHVLFIAGFDPKSPRYYQALYRSHARRQARISGLTVQVAKERTQPGPHSTAWALRADAPDGAVHTTFELLQWDDLVRTHWSDSPAQVFVDGIRAVAHGTRDGAIRRMYRLFRPPVYATLFPLVVLAACAAVAALLGVAATAALGVVLGKAGPTGAWVAGVSGAGGVATAIGGMALMLRWVHRIQITWLLRLVWFTVQQATGRVPALDARLQAFAERIVAMAGARRLADPQADPPPDEVLVIGHSVGATLAVSALARALERDPALGGSSTADGTARPNFALLSLGQCIPLLSTIGRAEVCRADLQRVADSPIDWLDISAPIDWAAFPGIDPVAGSGLAARPGWHPKLLSPRFHQLFGEAGYARLKRKRFLVHMQYLMASERLGAYDYFGITAGPLTLQARFADTDTPPTSAPTPTPSETHTQTQTSIPTAATPIPLLAPAPVPIQARARTEFDLPE